MIEHLDNVVLFHSKCGVISDKYKDLVFSGLTMTIKPETEEEISFYKGFMNDSKYIYSDVNYLNKMDISSYDLLKSIKPDVFISHYLITMTNSHRMHLNDGSIGNYLCKVKEHIAPTKFLAMYMSQQNFIR